MRESARRSLCVLAAVALGATACAAGEERERLHVFAAASLTDVFTGLAEGFEDAHPGTEVTLNFAGSGDLAVQITSGAPADVFAAADTATMARVAGEGGVDPAWAAEHGERGAVFATNTLRIAVPPNNPAGVGGLADLAEEDVAVALCAEEVPCGAASRTATDAAGVEVTPVTYEEDVRAVLTKVELGEVDAGLVYATDVAAAGDRVRGLEFPEADTAVNAYPIAVLAGAADPGLAAAWVDLVRSEAGRDALAAAGFGAP
ncbi:MULTISPECIES: molybdate ABC transporter substrate-binding protein [unclassified Nocardiopsis]|uniref:molybdate ABC transporter substrate-binding protein n=1 Tax=unclassified Nocardiopsis TaxID=2649073 RepID=UPI001357130B|nr:MULTISPECIES: molybdate ABC transporter substrate-binding protein [unclassified Nocardiopsis]